MKPVVRVVPSVMKGSMICHKCKLYFTSENINQHSRLCVNCVKWAHIAPNTDFCEVCLSYTDCVWNNMCSNCRSYRVLCDTTGYFFCCSTGHNNMCWDCVTAKEMRDTCGRLPCECL